MKALLLTAALVVTLVEGVNAQPSLYELQSRCGHDAAAVVAREVQGDLDEVLQAGHTISEYKASHYYENNYSPSMSGCFILLTMNTTLRGDEYFTESLIDASTSRTLGYFTTAFEKQRGTSHKGEFNGVEYTDEKQWKAKIRPYLYNQ